jgi:DNA primase
LQIREKQIGVSFVGEYAYRVIIPVFSGSSLKGIVGRDFTGKQTPKYRNSRGDKYLFNFDPSHSRVILCEGVFKALRLEQALPRYNCCAMLGHDLTSLQEEQIRSGRCKEVLIWPDPDRAGTLGAIRTADLLSERFRVSVAWPLSLPADEASLNELQESARSVKPYGWRTAQELLYFPHRVLYTMHSSKTDCEVPR